MTLLESIQAAVPFDPTVAIAVVASVMLVVFVAIMVFIALAPHVSPTWERRFANHSISTPREVGAQEAD